MRKIINGKAYDTETAQTLAVWENGLERGDFRFVREDLYLKKTGEYFLYCQGGAMTIYSKQCSDNSYTYGHAIIPLTLAEAKTWGEERLPADVYEGIFGKCEE